MNCECGQPKADHYGERGLGGSSNPECDGYWPLESSDKLLGLIAAVVLAAMILGPWLAEGR